MTEQAHSWIMDIRRRLSALPATRLAGSDARAASVLVPLYVDAGQLWTVLTRRTDHLPSHKGQVAFPGGAHELGETPWDAALRETEEELGLPRAKVLKVGELDELETSTGFRVVPCVGAVPFPLDLDANEDEIAEVFAVPLLAFADVKVVEEREVTVNGKTHSIRFYHVGRRRVWGVTARIVQNLLARLGLDAGKLQM